jgi:hypothetical protein
MLDPGGPLARTTLSLTIVLVVLCLSGRSPESGTVQGFSPAGRPGAGGAGAIGSSRATALNYMRQCRQLNRTTIFGFAGSAQDTRPAVSVTLGADGRLVYATDLDGNRIVDFSHAGYGGGGAAIPDVPARIVVGPGGGRDRERIQAAIDLVSEMPVDGSGFRGAVLLERGSYHIDADIHIGASGVVLRGSGTSEDGTVLVATGTSRRSLVTLEGRGDRQEIAGSKTRISDAYAPVGSHTIAVDNAAGFAPGDRVVVQRPSTAEWIALLGMNTFPGWRPEDRLHWQPGSRDIVWDRVVTAVDGQRVTLDAPLTTALEQRYGGGWLLRYEFPGRISHVGVENVRLVSEYDPARPLDEDHAWFAITLDRVEDAWVRHVSAAHFVSYVINAEAQSKWLTIEDVEALSPVSEIGGYRRRVFYTAGQLARFRRCRSEHGRHDFAVGFTAAGPNVFLESLSRGALDFSGPLESWASGVLYDNVIIRGNALRFTNRGAAGQGQGWAAANSVSWNSEATDIEVLSPPGAINQAYGNKGVVTGDGIVWDPRTMPYRDFYRGMPVKPYSLYLAQLTERLGPQAVAAIEPRAITADGSGASRLTDADVAAFVARQLAASSTASPGPLQAKDGAFTIGGQRAWTARVGYSWFQAQMPRTRAKTFGPALTRFAPGRTGVGLTDDVDEVAASMPPRSAFYQHYGLWYDRRRVDHNYYGSPEQRTGDVWAPFIELPWARSGTGKAWDGLSKYDLTRFNPWYFERVKAFADAADRRGLILYHNFYFQHWVLESRSHYVDFPWRPVNTIQDTGLPDEVPAANSFYDVSHPLRRELHRRYIRYALDNLKDNTNVVHGIDREYTGPIEFVWFWLDTIAEWRKEHGTTLFVSLEIPKDQMDAILGDPVRGEMIAAIDILDWTYRAGGTLFAVRGGINRSPREQRPDIATPEEREALKKKLGISPLDQKDFLNGPEFQRLFDTLWASSKPMKYRAWREYRDAYPQLVTLWNGDEYPALTLAIEKAIPASVRMGMRPADLVRSPRDTGWAVSKPGEIVVYSTAGLPVALDLSHDQGAYTLRWVGPGAEQPGPPAAPVRGGRVVTLTPPVASAPCVAWLSRTKRLRVKSLPE